MKIWKYLFFSLVFGQLSAEVISMNHQNVTEVLQSDLPVIIDVYADWCPPCSYFAPVFQEVSEEYDGRYQFVKLDAEKEGELVRKYRIRGLPTLLFFKGGKEVGRKAGALSKEGFEATIQEMFKN